MKVLAPEFPGYTYLYNTILWPLSPLIATTSNVDSKPTHSKRRHVDVDTSSDNSSRLSSFEELGMNKIQFRNESIDTTPPRIRSLLNLHSNSHSTIADFSYGNVYKKRNAESINRSHRKVVSKVLADEYATVIKVVIIYVCFLLLTIIIYLIRILLKE